MNGLSIPVIVIASISFYVGFYHILIFLRRKLHREDLSFSFLCLITGLYDVFCVGLYNATSVSEGVKWQRAQFMALAFLVPAFLWFVADYTHKKARAHVYAYSAFFLLAFFVQAVDRSTLTWILDPPFIKSVTVPFGLKITYYEASLGLFTTIQSYMGLVASVYVLWSGMQFYRRGYKREATALLAAIGFMFLAAANDTAVSSGLYTFIYTIEYGYTAIIILMALSLSNTVIDAANAKDALRSSEERIRALVETTSDWVWEINQDGVYTYSSPKVRDLLGYEPEEILGKRPFDFMPPEEAKRALELFQEISANRRPFDALENINLSKDGKLVILETGGVPVFDVDNNFIGYRGIDRDITNRKQAEKDLLQRTEEINRFFDVAIDLLCIADTDGYFLRLNPVWEKTLGYTRDELMSVKFFEFVHPEDLEATMKSVMTLASQQEVVNFFNRYRCKDGTYRWLEWRSVPSGNLIYAAARDITESKKAEQALRESQQMLRSVLDTIPVRVFWKDRESTFLGCNRPFAQDAGLNSPEDLVGKNDFQINWAEQAELYRADDRAVMDTGSSKLNYEEPQTTPDGHRIWLRTSKVPLLDAENQVKGVLGTYEDITERKRSDEAIQRQLKELTILHAVALAGNQADSSEELIESVLTTIGDAFNLDNIGVHLIQENEGYLGQHLTYRDVEKNILDHVPLSTGITGRVARTGQPARIRDVCEDPDYLEVIPETRSELCVPIKIGGRIIGVINAESRQIDFFSQEDELLLVTVAGALGTALEKLRLFESEHKRRQEAETLRQSVAAVISSLELNQVLNSLLISLKQVVPYDRASVMLQEGDRFTITAAQGFFLADQVIHQSLPADNELLSQARRLKKPVYLSDPMTDTRFKSWVSTEAVGSWMGVPLVYRDSVIGFITLESKMPAAYDNESATVAQAFAQQAAVAIENARLYEQAVRATQRQGILHRVGQDIARVSQDLERIYATVHQAASQLMPAEAFVISLMDENQKNGEAVYLIDKGGRSPNVRFPIKEGLSGYVIATAKPLILADISKQPFSGAVHFGADEEVRSVLAVPIRLGEKVTGMLSAQSYRPGAYTQEDLTLLEMLAAYTAVAIENARLYAETSHRLTELEAVSRISTALGSAQTVDDMLPLLLDETMQALETDAGAIDLFDASTGLLKPVATRGWFDNLSREPTARNEGLSGMVFSTGQVVLTEEFASDPRTIVNTRSQMPGGWGGACVPIRSMQETIGVLFVSVRLPRRLQADEIHLLGTICEIAGNALRRADLHQQTERQVQRLASLRAVDTAISTILDLRVILGVLLDHIITQLKVDAVDVLLLNQNTQTLEHAASLGFYTDAIKQVHLYMGEGLASRVIRDRGLVYIPNILGDTQDLRRKFMVGEGFVTYFGMPLIAKGQIKGVLEIYNRTPMTPDLEWRSFFETLARETAIAIENAALFEELQRSNLDLSLAYDATIEGWSKALDLRDRETEGHTLRVTEKTLELARLMGVGDLDLVHIRRGALLHDIGKMGVPDSILYKSGDLTDEEWKIMRRHPSLAYEMLSPIPYLRPALDIPYCHHEDWNGSGYPRGLEGEQIPMAARIFAIVDVWDALTSDRPYRKAWTRKSTVEYIENNRGSKFDPQIVENFLKMIGNEKRSKSERR